MGGSPAPRRDWRAVVAAVVVLATLVAWVQAFAGFSVWFAGVDPGLLLAALGLPLSGLSLTTPQRVAGLAAVTVFAVWLVMFAPHAFAVQTYLYDGRSTGIGLIGTLATAGACYLAQVRLPDRRPAAGADAPR